MAKFAVIQMCACSNVGINLFSLKKYIEQAKIEGADIVVLPDYAFLLSDDSKNHALNREFLGEGRIQKALSQWASNNQIWIIASGIPILAMENGKQYYSATLVYDAKGEMVSHYYHIHRTAPNGHGGLLKEDSALAMGNKAVMVDTPYGRIGLLSSADIFDGGLCGYLHAQGVDFFAYNAFVPSHQGAEWWWSMLKARAIEYQIPILCANQSGFHEDIGEMSHGNSAIFDRDGRILASHPLGEAVLIAELQVKKRNTTYLSSPFTIQYRG